MSEAEDRATTEEFGLYRLARRAAVAVTGALLIAGGMALVVLPGPFTSPLVLAGLVVLSREFAWAKRLRMKVRRTSDSLARRARSTPDRSHSKT